MCLCTERRKKIKQSTATYSEEIIKLVYWKLFFWCHLVQFNALLQVGPASFSASGKVKRGYDLLTTQKDRAEDHGLCLDQRCMDQGL